MSRVRLGALIGILSAFVIVIAIISCKPEGGGNKTDTSNTTYTKAEIPKDWIETETDVFAGMDGVTLPPNTTHDENNPLRGRIVWNLWIGDSWKMWDYLAQHGFGTADMIKTVDSRRHNTRFAEVGIINQPGFVESTKPDQYGLYIDAAAAGNDFDQKVDTHTYGRSTGVIGLRMYDNPEFTGAAKQAWVDEIGKTGGYAKRFYEDPSYYNNPKLVRPYVVGMSCALCHVSFDPVRPPADVNNPKWENLNDYVGAQYFNVCEFFVPRRFKDGKIQPLEEDSFIWQLIHSSPSGSLDTSFIATDYLNNPGTMNGVFTLKPGRLDRAAKAVSKDPGKYDPMVEWLTGGALNLLHIREDIDKSLVIPRVLKQGDDSVGFEGALSRVYVNIGHAWPQWQQHFRPLIGGPFPGNPGLASQSPVTVQEMQMNSASWNWSEARSRALAIYFVQYAKPLLLRDAPGGKALIDESKLEHGKEVFADNCAACHSSKQPPADPFGADGKITQDARNWFRAEVKKPDFFTDNFLSDERRHPVTQIGTNSTRAAATNATRNHIWDNFSSETYKTLPAIGQFQVDNPPDYGGKTTINIPLPGESNGPGYYRPPSLISLWSSAPYLHNNTVGIDPTAPPLRGKVDVASRMAAFQDGIEKMLWIKPRGKLVWTTTQRSTINIPRAYLEKPIQALFDLHPDLYDKEKDAYTIGPIPKGTPINLLANTNLDPGIDLALKRIALFTALIDTEIKIKTQKLDDAAATKLMLQNVVPKLLAVNKCPDFYEDKGHEFGKELSEADKRALIELLKTF